MSGYYFRSKTRAEDLTGSLGANTRINVQLHIQSATQVQLLAASAPLTPQVGVYDSNNNVKVLEIDSTLTADITQSGAGGLQEGDNEHNDVDYYIWLIYKPSTGTKSLLLSGSATSPTLPTGYTYKGLIGWVHNDADGDFSHCATLSEDLFSELGDWIHYRDPFENEIDDPGDGGTIDISRTGRCLLSNTAGDNQTRSLPTPTVAGREISLVAYIPSGGNIVVNVASAINQNGDDTITFDATGEYIRLESVNMITGYRWRVVSSDGVGLSH